MDYNLLLNIFNKKGSQSFLLILCSIEVNFHSYVYIFCLLHDCDLQELFCVRLGWIPPPALLLIIKNPKMNSKYSCTLQNIQVHSTQSESLYK